MTLFFVLFAKEVKRFLAEEGLRVNVRLSLSLMIPLT